MKLIVITVSLVLLVFGILAHLFNSKLSSFDDPLGLENRPKEAFQMADGDSPSSLHQLKRSPDRRKPRVHGSKIPPVEEVTASNVEPTAPPIAMQLPKYDGADAVELVPNFPDALFEAEGIQFPFDLTELGAMHIGQPSLMTPPDLTNLARGKTVSSSDPLPVIGDLAYITDGNKAAADGSYVQLGPKKQWVQIDLGQRAELWGIWVWHYQKSPRIYKDVIVQVSDDSQFAAEHTTTLFNTDRDNSFGFGPGADKVYLETNRGRGINAGGLRARYVRFFSNGNTDNDFNHYIEVEVWARGIQEEALQASTQLTKERTVQ